MAQMQQNGLTCFNRVGGRLKCCCNSNFYVKHGKTSRGEQRYKCKVCCRTFIEHYIRKAYITPDTSITSLLTEGCGIRSISRLLKISGTTVLKRILVIAKNIHKPFIPINKSYEVDEVCTFYKTKSRLLWIAYALQKETRQVADFAIGSRTKSTLQKVINTLCLSRASKIYTDKLPLYSFIVPSNIHCTDQYGIIILKEKIYHFAPI
jgi:transposase-like protein